MGCYLETNSKILDVTVTSSRQIQVLFKFFATNQYRQVHEILIQVYVILELIIILYSCPDCPRCSSRCCFFLDVSAQSEPSLEVASASKRVRAGRVL